MDIFDDDIFNNNNSSSSNSPQFIEIHVPAGSSGTTRKFRLHNDKITEIKKANGEEKTVEKPVQVAFQALRTIRNDEIKVQTEIAKVEAEIAKRKRDSGREDRRRERMQKAHREWSVEFAENLQALISEKQRAYDLIERNKGVENIDFSNIAANDSQGGSSSSTTKRRKLENGGYANGNAASDENEGNNENNDDVDDNDDGFFFSGNNNRKSHDNNDLETIEEDPKPKSKKPISLFDRRKKNLNNSTKNENDPTKEDSTKDKNPDDFFANLHKNIQSEQQKNLQSKEQREKEFEILQARMKKKLEEEDAQLAEEKRQKRAEAAAKRKAKNAKSTNNIKVLSPGMKLDQAEVDQLENELYEKKTVKRPFQNLGNDANKEDLDDIEAFLNTNTNFKGVKSSSSTPGKIGKNEDENALDFEAYQKKMQKLLKSSDDLLDDDLDMDVSSSKNVKTESSIAKLKSPIAFSPKNRPKATKREKSPEEKEEQDITRC